MTIYNGEHFYSIGPIESGNKAGDLLEAHHIRLYVCSLGDHWVDTHY